jgi:tRNA/rRNA methyltransferase
LASLLYFQDNGMSTFNDVTIVLVDTLYGGNLGSVARAMANFGLSDLRLVRPAGGVFADKMLEPMARESGMPIVKRAKLFQSLEDALEDVELAMGFTTRLGKKRRDGYDLRPAIKELKEVNPSGKLAAVFGSEDKGLNNEDLDKCSWLVRIPTAPELSSLNLSQAVSTVAWELFATNLESAPKPKEERNVAAVADMEGLYDHMHRVLLDIGYFKEEEPPRMMNTLRRIFSRRLPEPRDVRILRGIFSKMETALKRARQGLDS